MSNSDIDFGLGESFESGNADSSNVSSQSTSNNPLPPENDLDGIDNLNDSDNERNNVNGDNNNPNPNNEDNDNNNNEESSNVINPGDEIEFNGKVYHVDENRNIVDTDGNIFKKADEVNKFLEENQVSDDNDVNINTIQKAIGVTINDENGNPIEFENTPDGITSYVNSVIQNSYGQIQHDTINSFLDSVPYLRDFVNYLQLHDNNPEGFGEMKDRSTIELDPKNESQLVNIIKMAASEFGNKSVDDNYIAYLKSTNALYDAAKQQLAALVEKDNEERAEMERQVAEAKAKDEADTKAYWNYIHGIIDEGKIGGYEIPKSTVISRNGQKTTVTRDDFYRYLSEPIQLEDGSFATMYQIDMNRKSQSDVVANQLIEAWVEFTGGSYADLVKMAINKENVRRIVLASKQAKTSGIKINKPAKDKYDNNDIAFF